MLPFSVAEFVVTLDDVTEVEMTGGGVGLGVWAFTTLNANVNMNTKERNLFLKFMNSF